MITYLVLVGASLYKEATASHFVFNSKIVRVFTSGDRDETMGSTACIKRKLRDLKIIAVDF